MSGWFILGINAAALLLLFTACWLRRRMTDDHPDRDPSADPRSPAPARQSAKEAMRRLLLCAVLGVTACDGHLPRPDRMFHGVIRCDWLADHGYSDRQVWDLWLESRCA